MPASAATKGRAAASRRAAIVLSADVSVSTIQNHADIASAPSTSSRLATPQPVLYTAELAHGKQQSTGGLLDGKGAGV